MQIPLEEKRFHSENQNILEMRGNYPLFHPLPYFCIVSVSTEVQTYGLPSSFCRYQSWYCKDAVETSTNIRRAMPIGMGTRSAKSSVVFTELTWPSNPPELFSDLLSGDEATPWRGRLYYSNTAPRHPAAGLGRCILVTNAT